MRLLNFNKFKVLRLADARNPNFFAGFLFFPPWRIRFRRKLCGLCVSASADPPAGGKTPEKRIQRKGREECRQGKSAK